MNELPSYATVEQVEAGFRPLTTEETAKCSALIVEAGVMVDAIATNAAPERKCVVVCRMVRRALGGGDDVPLGASQGTVSALGYSQTWSLGTGGASGELYIGKAERTLLGVSNKIGASNPFAEVESGA